MARGGMHGKGGHAWQGVCVAGGHTWQGVCMAGRRVCVAGEMAVAAGGTHPTGMHSCNLHQFKKTSSYIQIKKVLINT